MHPKNPYYAKKPDFARLASRYPVFAPFVCVAEDGYASIDFKDAAALRALTTCLLKEDWGYDVELPEDRLCPTLANRADYLLHVLDVYDHVAAHSSRYTGHLRDEGSSRLRVLDIGTGAVAIYPLLLLNLRPESQICATELDETSYRHARATLRTNSIPETSIQVLQAPLADEGGRILFPLFDPEPPNAFDLTVCNPPFFVSEEEMQRGTELKAEEAHAAGTAAANELITPGGEVAFVKQMITDSLDAAEVQAQRGAAHAWYTSLIGKYASLQPLVHFLKERNVDNYFVETIRQARTSRWILGWSFSPVRLPDSLIRPENLIHGTSFAHLLPPATTLSHTPVPPLDGAALRERVVAVLKTINMPVEWYKASEKASAVLVPMSNTWSRAARRQAQRDKTAQGGAPDGTQGTKQDTRPSLEPLFIAKLSFEEQAKMAADESGEPAHADGATLQLEWLQGKDRQVVDAFWKFLLTKAELLGTVLPVASEPRRVPPPSHSAKRARADTRGRS